jgi:uncharacterized damage-inducible protein DinB
MTPEEIRLLFDFNEWANQRTLDAVAQLSNEQFVKPMGSSFPSICDTLEHICGGEWVWLERFQGRSPETFPAGPSEKNVAALREHWRPVSQHLLICVRGLSQIDLERTLEYKTFNFGAYSNPFWQSLQHLANHGTYHRGQIATMLRQQGAKPILTDLMHFYRERATTPKA